MHDPTRLNACEVLICDMTIAQYYQNYDQDYNIYKRNGSKSFGKAKICTKITLTRTPLHISHKLARGFLICPTEEQVVNH